MPPRKTKVVSKTPAFEETPIVFFLKFTEDIFESILPAGDANGYSELDSENKLSAVSYSSILNSVDVFTNPNRFNTELLKSILEKTNIDSYSVQTACFWCCHEFSWSPAVLPTSYDSYKNIYSAEGNFCSPECALSYNYSNTRISDSIKWNRHAMLGDLYSRMYVDKVLSPAPPRTTLRMFGGPLDIEQFRDYIVGENNIILSDLPPIRLQFHSMNVQAPLRDIKKYVSLSVDVVEKASEQLRLKRSKPANMNMTTLDKCLSKVK